MTRPLKYDDLPTFHHPSQLMKLSYCKGHVLRSRVNNPSTKQEPLYRSVATWAEPSMCLVLSSLVGRVSKRRRLMVREHLYILGALINLPLISPEMIAIASVINHPLQHGPDLSLDLTPTAGDRCYIPSHSLLIF